MHQDIRTIVSRKKRLFLKNVTFVNMSRKCCFLLLFSFALLNCTAKGLAAQEAGTGNNDSKEKIAIFDFENLSEFDGALTYVMPAVANALENKGLALQDENDLSDFLIRERVRSTGYISRELAKKLRKDLNATAVLLGTVYAFSTGSNPQLGLSARLVDSSTGEILWAEYASATGDDFTSVFGLGALHTMKELLPVVVERLFASFSTTPPLKVSEETYRIAVMPFLNKTELRERGMIPSYMFMVELFRNARYVPVEFGEIRSSIVNARIRDRGEVDYRSITSISESMDVDGILVGAVELYSDGRETGSAPEVAISARLIDARNNRILWYDGCQANGDEDIFILDFGKIRSVDKVAYKVVSKLIKKMEKTEWK